MITWFLIKHFVCDFITQAHSSRKGSRVTSEWLPDIVWHCMQHALATVLVVMSFGIALGVAAQVAVLDFILHFVIDRLKAHPDIGGRWKPSQKAFWIALGADQLAHGLCYVWYASLLAS